MSALCVRCSSLTSRRATYANSLRRTRSISTALDRFMTKKVPTTRITAASSILDAGMPPANLEEEIQRYAAFLPTSVTMKAHALALPLSHVALRKAAAQADASHGLGAGERVRLERQRMLLQLADFLRRELMVRLARKVVELDTLPDGLSAMPSVLTVRSWYVQSFIDIRDSREPVCPESEHEFFLVVKHLFERDAPVLVKIARAVHEHKEQLLAERGPVVDFGQLVHIHEALDRFYTSRIGIRVLIGQYVELHDEDPPPGYVGLINRHTSPVEICSVAAEDAKFVCRQAYGIAPDVHIVGRKNLTFPYIPSHLYYCTLELLKNSLRATVERHGVDAPEEEGGGKQLPEGGALPSVRIVIADDEGNEDVGIRISDEGGGIRRSHMPRVWSYLFTSARPAFESQDGQFTSAGGNTRGRAAPVTAKKVVDVNRKRQRFIPMAGLGYGLPISRCYARYLGGDLTIVSLEGHGTDSFLHLPRLGDRAEPLH